MSEILEQILTLTSDSLTQILSVSECWPLLYFYSTTGSWKILVYIKRTSIDVCIFAFIYLPACSVVQIFCKP